MCKANKSIGIIRKFNNTLPRTSPLTIYKSLVRPHFDYCDMMYDQLKKSFCNNIERVQYNAALAVTVTVRGSRRLYKEPSLESLEFRRWFRRMRTFFKIKKTWCP